MADATATTQRRPIRWHIAVFLAPAVFIYSMLMIIPLISTLGQSTMTGDITHRAFIGIGNFVTLFTDPRWSSAFWNALRNNLYFFFINMVVQNPIGVLLAALTLAIIPILTLYIIFSRQLIRGITSGAVK